MIPTSVSIEVLKKTPAGLGVFIHVIIDVLAWNYPEAKDKAWVEAEKRGFFPVQIKSVSSSW